MQLYVSTMLNTFSAKEMDTILMTFQEKIEPKSISKGVAVALLYYGLFRATEVEMIEME